MNEIPIRIYYGSSIAFAIRSFDPSLFVQLILPYSVAWSIHSFEGSLSRSSIAVVIHSVDHSLFTRLIGFSLKLYYTCVKLSIQKLLVIGVAQRVVSLESLWDLLSGLAIVLIIRSLDLSLISQLIAPYPVTWSLANRSVNLFVFLSLVMGKDDFSNKF